MNVTLSLESVMILVAKANNIKVKAFGTYVEVIGKTNAAILRNQYKDIIGGSWMINIKDIEQQQFIVKLV